VFGDQALALAHALGWSPEKIKKLAANLAEDMRVRQTLLDSGQNLGKT
jgi:hypothetical protein